MHYSLQEKLKGEVIFHSKSHLRTKLLYTTNETFQRRIFRKKEG